MIIFHTGDVHLDTPFSGMSVSMAEKRRQDVRNTFSQMMEYASDIHADLVVIAGDLFDASFVTRDTMAYLKNDFEKLSCPIVIAPGNHDPNTENSVWRKNIFPENVFVFDKQCLQKFSFDDLNLDVYGWAFESSDMIKCPIEDVKAENPNRINLLVGHGDTVSPISTNCPIPKSLIEKFGADFCLLGHIHNPQKANEALGDLGMYCGCPEGRDFGETGEKGAYIVEISKNDIKRKFVRFSQKVYEKRDLNIDGAADNLQIEKNIQALIDEENFGDETILKIRLCGSVEPSLIIDAKWLEKKLCDNLCKLTIEDATIPTWNADTLMYDAGIKGEVFRLLKPFLESEEADKRKKATLALRFALSAMNGENIGQ